MQQQGENPDPDGSGVSRESHAPFCEGLAGKFRRSTLPLTARYYKDGSEILIRQQNRNPRRLTPRECARLMGFEKPGGTTFKIPVSDTRAYKQFGNSVVAPVVETVARHMQPYLVTTRGKMIAQKE